MCAEPQFCLLVFEAIRPWGHFLPVVFFSNFQYLWMMFILTASNLLCQVDDVGVEGFPTIKFGDPANLEDYEGEREFDDLAKFAKDNLGPRCQGESHES